MSLLDAMLLEGYRDPRDVWIALRSDGAKGSGTIDDPYDGSRKSFATHAISSLTKGGLDNRVATAVTAANHPFVAGDRVTISGVGTGQTLDRYYTGTFAVASTTSNSFTYQMLEEPSSASATGTVIAVREREQFDAVMRAAPANCVIRLGPGLFETKGFAAGIANYELKNGQQILGSGRAATTLKLVGAGWPEIAYLPLALHVYYGLLEDFGVSDLTFDCNIAGQPELRVSCAAVAIAGRNVRLRRLRAINFASQTAAYIENFVFGVGAPHPNGGPEGVNCLIEDCIAEAPGFNSSNNSSIFILFSGERPNDGIMAWHRASVIRHCWYDGTFVDRPVSISGITISGGLATVTTRVPHGRNNNDWVVITGAVESGATQSAYNGTYQISNVSSTQFSYTPVAYLGRDGALSAPTTNPTGEMWVDRYSGHRIPVQKLERDAGDSTVGVLTSHGPHFRKPGQRVRVYGVNPPVAGTEPYYGWFPIVEIISPGVLKYQMDSAPTKLIVQDTACSGGSPTCQQDAVFLGVANVGFSTDGGSEAVAEGNRVFNTAFGGSYHDTWGTKDQTDRNNYYSDVLTGPYQLMGQSNAPKPGSCLVHNGAVATFSTEQPHGLSAGQSVDIRGAVVNGSYSNPYNGNGFTIASSPAPTANTFSYSMASTPASNAGGSPVFGAVQTGTLERITNDPVFGLVAVFTKAGHGFNVGDLISVFGVSVGGSIDNAYNGVVQIVAKDSNTFTYRLASDPGSTYSGTPTCAKALGTPLTAAGTTATFRTVLPHGLVVGQAVEISRPFQQDSSYLGFFAITSVPSPTSFAIQLDSSPAAPAQADHESAVLWQVGLAVREGNVMELGQGHHVGLGPNYGYGYSTGLPFYSGSHGTQYAFRRVIARDNLIRLTVDSSNPLARAIQIRNTENALVERNFVDVIYQPPIDVLISKPLHFFDNQTWSGALVRPAAEDPFEPISDELRIRVDDALILAL